jgi:hypothetical protein
MTHIEDELVPWGIEDPMKGDGELYNPKVRSQMASSLGENSDQLGAHLFSEKRQIFFSMAFTSLGE